MCTIRCKYHFSLQSRPQDLSCSSFFFLFFGFPYNVILFNIALFLSSSNLDPPDFIHV